MAIAGALMRVLGGAGAQAASQAAKGGTLKQLGRAFAEEAINSIPAGLMSGIYYGSQYSDQPLAAAGLIGADLLGSAALRVGTGALMNKIRPARYDKVINPVYAQNLKTLGLEPGATADQIQAAKRQVIANVPKSGIADPASPGAVQIRQATEAARDLSAMKPQDFFTQERIPSRLGSALGTAADIGFSFKGMEGIENALIGAGLITPAYMQQGNPGLVDQSSVINQQLDNRSQQGTPNNAVLSGGTMSQLSAMEIQRVMDELMMQAEDQKQAAQGSLDDYALASL